MLKLTPLLRSVKLAKIGTLVKKFMFTVKCLNFTKKSLTCIVESLGYQIISCDVFRPATKSEGIKQRIFKNTYQFYPRILTDIHSGRDLRLILKNS